MNIKNYIQGITVVVLIFMIWIIWTFCNEVQKRLSEPSFDQKVEIRVRELRIENEAQKRAFDDIDNDN